MVALQNKIYRPAGFRLALRMLPAYAVKSSSSSATAQKKSQSMQFWIFNAKFPWTSPKHNVPAIAQQHRPPFTPPLIPFPLVSSGTGHTP